ncbi:MAG: cyclopropane-fatty-acyl-phospholipid synthase family protein [Pseudomonadales bacterium]|nr:cyclopropane-fatty-acyl-phospholipid synthase family protein [Pseudomonadales bacterium]
MYDRFIRENIKHGAFKLVYPNGDEQVFGDGPASVVWRINDTRVLSKIARNPLLNLGETYIEQGWDVEDGKLAQLLTILRTNFEDELVRRGSMAAYAAILQTWNNLHASMRNVSHHYDLDESLFRAFLDQDMHYSCAYFRTPEQTLEAAQSAKCEHIRKKLCLKPGQKVLDIGSGWGSLGLYLAEQEDVQVTGLTLSNEQLGVAKEHAIQRGLDNQVEFRLEDYRNHQGEYDAVVSVGMFEHVGLRNFDGYFNKVGNLLSKDGIAMIHTIGHMDRPAATNPWIRRHIFPGGYIPAISEISTAIERSPLVFADIEVWRQHYALTLKEWNRRFQTVRSEFARDKGERFCRIWEFYLLTCQTAFEVESLVVYQLQLSINNASVPTTRDYLYDTP